MKFIYIYLTIKSSLFNITQSSTYKPLRILAAMAIFYSASGFATCTATDVTVTFPNIQLNLNAIPLNGPIGSEIITPAQTIYTCTSNSSVANRYISDPGGGGTTIMGQNIYPTSVPGIGYAVALEPTNFCNNLIQWVPFTTCKTPESTTRVFNAKLHFQLYKIAAVSNASNITIFKNNFLIREINSSSTLVSSAGVYMTSTPFNMTIYSCSLQTASISNITLPPVSSTSLPSIGSTSGRIPFNLLINCPNPTKLAITFTDNNNMTQTSSILSLASTSTAKGLGIQLRYNGNIISFGPDSAEPGTTNQIMLNGNLTGTQGFPFTASYVRTGAVTPGSLSATATFTLSYQ